MRAMAMHRKSKARLALCADLIVSDLLASSRCLAQGKGKNIDDEP